MPTFVDFGYPFLLVILSLSGQYRSLKFNFQREMQHIDTTVACYDPLALSDSNSCGFSFSM